MKFKVTRKEIKENYRCVSVGYCDLQYLLRYLSPIAYNSGVYGWNFDVYTFEQYSTNIAICTGYRGMPGKNLYKTGISCQEWNQKAQDIISKYQWTEHEKVKEELEKLLKEFLALIEEKLFN